MDYDHINQTILKMVKEGQAKYVPLKQSKVSNYTKTICQTYLEPLKIEILTAANIYQGADLIKIDDDYIPHIIVYNDPPSRFSIHNDENPEGLHPDLLSAHIIKKLMPDINMRVVIDDETGESKIIAEKHGARIIATDNRDDEDRIVKITRQ